MIKQFWQWLGFHIHDWSEWETQGEISVGSNKRIVGYWQLRRCKTCHKEQINQVR